MTHKRIFRGCFVGLALACTAQVFAGGLSAWRETVPGGYELSHAGDDARVVVLDSAGNVVLTRFYLYRDALVAEYDPAVANRHRSEAAATNSKRFYIVRGQNVQAFSDEDVFENALTKERLTPFLTRWHDYEFGLRFWTVLLAFMLPAPLVLPILWLLCLASLLTRWRWQRGLRKWLAVLYPGGVGLLALATALPQSF